MQCYCFKHIFTKCNSGHGGSNNESIKERYSHGRLIQLKMQSSQTRVLDIEKEKVTRDNRHIL